MSAKPLDKTVVAAIIVDWRLGRLSQRDIAEKHKVSKGSVNKLCKGLEQDCADIVTAGVEYNQLLAQYDERMITAIMSEVDVQTRYIRFFNDAAIANVQSAMATPCERQSDFKARADTILKGRGTVLGKATTVLEDVGKKADVLSMSTAELEAMLRG